MGTLGVFYLDEGDGGAVEEAEDEEDDEGRGRGPEVAQVLVLLHAGATQQSFWGEKRGFRLKLGDFGAKFGGLGSKSGDFRTKFGGFKSKFGDF